MTHSPYALAPGEKNLYIQIQKYYVEKIYSIFVGKLPAMPLAPWGEELNSIYKFRIYLCKRNSNPWENPPIHHVPVGNN